MKSWATFLFFVALLVGAALRLPDLGNRPMHNDEAVNAIKFGALWERGEYRYDPHEYHGPTLHYLTAVLCGITGAPAFEKLDETRLRLISALAGLGLILLVPFIRDELGKVGAAAVAIFTAVSPLMVFYSRYWIHEMLLVLFSFLAMVAVWRWMRKPRWIYALVAGAAIGLMQATKETFVLALSAALAGGCVNALWTQARPQAGTRTLWTGRLVLVAAAAWGAIWLLFFSSFFQNWVGLMDSVRTYEPWLRNAGDDSIHSQPVGFYWERLFWFAPKGGLISSEALLLLLALVGALSGFVGNRDSGGRTDFVRWLAVYTFSLATIYTIIPYKTPWCALGFHHGIILLAGVGVAVGWHACKSFTARMAFAFVLMIGVAHLGWQAWRGSFEQISARSNPWVYSQTSPDLLNLVDAVEAVTGSGEGTASVIQVIGANDDYWPLPWYLRQYPKVGWWNHWDRNTSASLVIASAESKLGLEAEGAYRMVGYFQLRPQVFMELYVERQLWERYLASRPAPKPD